MFNSVIQFGTRIPHRCLTFPSNLSENIFGSSTPKTYDHITRSHGMSSYSTHPHYHYRQCQGQRYPNILTLNHASLSYWQRQARSHYFFESTSNDSQLQNGDVRRTSSLKFRFLKLILSMTFVAVGFVVWEIEWLKRQFMEIVPESVTRAGEGLPSKFIYPPIENFPWFLRHFSWISLCEDPVWHYIIQTKSHDKIIQDQAIKKLISLKGLSDAECTIIASAIDFKTAIALAHAGARPAMVSRPAVLHPDKKSMCLASKFREILSALPPDSIHEAMLNACFSALKTYQPTGAEKLDSQLDSASGFHHEFDSLRPLRNISEESFLRPCLKAVLSHSRIKDQVPIMLKNGAMDLLLVISEKYKNDHDIMGVVVKIFCSFACSPDSMVAFEESGILGLLAQLASSDDVRLSFPARKTLHNLDHAWSKYILPPGIYQVYPDSRCDENAFEVDIIFVHGLMGGAFRTWRSQDLNAIWRLKKHQLSNTDGLCESNPSSSLWQEKVGFIRRKILNPDQSDDDAKESPSPEDRFTFFKRMEQRFKSIPTKLLAPRDEDMEPKNREIRDGKMYYFLPHEEIPVELEILPVSLRTKCWPRDWLPLDFNNIRVICADFETFITHWTPVMPVESLGRTISERSHELIDKLATAGIGDRPIVWICHSAGGVIVKHVLELAEKSDKNELRKVSQMTRGVVFCSTPHFGSKIVGLWSRGKSIWLPTVEILELMKGSNELGRIDDAFQLICRKYAYQVVSFGELCPTLGSIGISRRLVPIDSSDPGYGEYYALRVDHLNICKPRSRRSFVYVKIRDVIGSIMEGEAASRIKEPSSNE